MKRILSVFLSFCLAVCLLTISAFATGNTYELDELGMSIELPPDYIVFTRDIKANDPNLSAYGLTKDGLSSLMQERSIYLNAWDEDINYEIIVTMLDSPFEDYNQFSDTSLSAFVSALDTEYAGLGITMIRSDIYQHSQAKFAKIYISQPNNGGIAYGLQYNTVYDGQAINITLQSYSGKIDSSKEAVLKNIVDSVHFDTEPQLNPPPAQTKAFTYTDPNSGMTFTVPTNWVETPMNEEREFIDVKFTSNLEEGLCIIFSSEDMLSDEFIEDAGVTSFEKLMVSRSDLNNSMLTKADVAAMYGESASAVSMVSYGNKEYFSFTTEQYASAYGVTAKVPVTVLARCENGFMYIFQFSGTKDSVYFADFEKLVSSVKYPVFENDETVRDQVLGAYLLLAIFVLITLCLLIVFGCRSAIKKKSIKAKQQATPTITEEAQVRAVPEVLQEKVKEAISPEIPTKEAEADPATTPLAEISETTKASFCHRCGNKLMSGSLFCNKCGTKIPTTEEE